MREGALKMKELTYLHCQALPLGGAQIANTGMQSYLKNNKQAPLIIVVLEKGGDVE